MRLSRRSLLVGVGGGALAGSGIYELVDRFAGSPSRSRSSSPPAVDHGEQHLLDGVREIVFDGVEVLVPSLHHEVVTATVKAGDLVRARRELTEALATLDARYPTTPAGLGITVAVTTSWWSGGTSTSTPSDTISRTPSSRCCSPWSTTAGDEEPLRLGEPAKWSTSP